MIIYYVKNKATEKITNQWTSEFAGADYYEPAFGAPGEYEIIPEDKTLEIAAEKATADAIKLKKEQAELALKSFDINKIKDADVRQAIQFILDKIQGL